jgi:hypothetical protein
MKRPVLNFVIDTAAFAGFILLATTGVLMRYILPPGSGGARLIWGMDRHEWGAIHFWISLTLLAILALHLVLHWQWIITTVTGRTREGSGLRAGLGIVGLLGMVALAASPLFSDIEVSQTAADHHERSSQTPEKIVILGSMSLTDVEEQTGLPAVYLIEKMGLPPDTDRRQRLGQLKRKYGFTMDDVRRAAEVYRAGGSVHSKG